MAWWDKLGLGIMVSRASATLPQTAAGALYTISGGAILIKYLLGRCTVAMGAVANNLSIEHSVGPTVMCAVLATANDTLGSLYHMTGDPAEPLRRILAAVGCMPGGFLGGLAAGAGLIANGIVCAVGNIQLRSSGNNTGEASWTLHYIPLEPGARVVAV